VLAEELYVGVYERMDRVTVVEAAARLGVKEQAIRKRIQRGTLLYDKDEDGRVYVYLDPEDGPTGTANGKDTLVHSLRDQIAYLRQEAQDWKEEARRKDTLIVSLTQRIPELEAAPEPRESPASPPEEVVGRGNLPPGAKVPSQRRSWLYRFFVGPQ